MQVIACAVLCIAFGAHAVSAQQQTITVQVNRPGIRISPTLYGLMTEEINHSYDGGLYAELIRNRIFRNSTSSPVHWRIYGTTASVNMSLDSRHAVSKALTTSLKVIVKPRDGKLVGVSNGGYWGIPVRPNTTYHASFYATAATGFHGPLFMSIASDDGTIRYASAVVNNVRPGWHKYSVVLKTRQCATTAAARFFVLSKNPGTFWLNLVSLFPPTYDNQRNGFRPDLMKMLAAMHPAFLRLPGGNYLEGNSISERFRWRRTLGPLKDRPGHESPWGYRSTDGMGLLEFLMWCEDLHMQPVLAVYAGYSLGGQVVLAGPSLKPYVQSALNEIQFVNGPANTTWGKIRARLGHPAPFPLHYVEVGNEDPHDNYSGRYIQFYKAIKARYPKLTIIATTAVDGMRPDMIDDHYYRTAAAMESDVHHYDTYNRKGPKTFVGEWASTEGSPTPTMNAALGDAAWLTGLEKNSDQVLISSYAPLLVNVNKGGAQWGTNLIGYNALSCFGSPSYYMQAMFGANRGDVVLPETTHAEDPTPVKPFVARGGVGIGTWDTEAEFRNIKVTDNGQTLYESGPNTSLSGWNVWKGSWQAANGVLKQVAPGNAFIATIGDPKWTDYTYTLQARKLGGKEGFLILFHVRNQNTWVWWNIGGWTNSRTAINQSINGGQSEFGQSAYSSVKTGVWYDIKIRCRGADVQCYLNGKRIIGGKDSLAPPKPVFTEASRDLKTGDVILKVVNITSSQMPLTIHLVGVNHLFGGVSDVIAGEPDAQNTIQNPRNVYPVVTRLTEKSPTFVHRFPAHSITVLRLKTHK